MKQEKFLKLFRTCQFPLVLFGASSTGRRIYTALERLGIHPICFCDNYKTGEDPDLHIKILSPEQIALNYPEAIVVVCMTPYEFQKEAIAQLSALSFLDDHIISFEQLASELSNYEFDWTEHEVTFDWHANEKYIKRMALWITADDKSVMDFGAGSCYLRQCLRSDITYTPIDYIARTPEFIAFDFNKDPFPDLHADVCFLAYSLPYVEKEKSGDFLKNVFAAAQRKVIVALGIPTDDNARLVKKLFGAKTIFSEDEIVESAKENGFVLKDHFRIVNESSMQGDRCHFLFVKK